MKFHDDSATGDLNDPTFGMMQFQVLIMYYYCYALNLNLNLVNFVLSSAMAAHPKYLMRLVSFWLDYFVAPFLKPNNRLRVARTLLRHLTMNSFSHNQLKLF